jgi:cytochrome c5
MKSLSVLLVIAAVLVACGKAEAPSPAAAPAVVDAVTQQDKHDVAAPAEEAKK